MTETPKPRAKPVHVTVPPDLLARLDDTAAVLGTTRSAILVELARWYVDEYGQPAMPRLPIPPRPPAE
jgi:metal-responsive CopG/Arc/MetJ family transcriptional regulator